jgi:hypothetical protein
MGMFDTFRCKYPLPWEGDKPNISDVEFQTKSLECFLDNYEIRSDGTLWHEEYDTEDHSDPTAEGILRFAGMLARVNQRWVPVELTGEVIFYGGGNKFSAYFVDGKLKELHNITGAKRAI